MQNAGWIRAFMVVTFVSSAVCFSGMSRILPLSLDRGASNRVLTKPMGRFAVKSSGATRVESPVGVRSLVGNAKSDFVAIYIGDGLKDQQLPLSMTKSFQHWILHEGSLRGIYHSDADGGEDGWVDPFSYDEAWLAEDLPSPVLRPAIGALIKGGELRYIMPALEMTVQCGGKLWWNRGVNTFPLARRWMDIGSADLTTLNLYAYGQDGYKTAEESVVEMGEDGEASVSDDAGEWKELWSAAPDKGLLSLVETLAGDAGECVANGFHVVVIPLSSEPLREAPAAGTRLKLMLTSSGATVAELDAGDDSDVGALGGEMDVLFRAASAGGTSEYLPQVYKELYQGISE